MHKKRSAPVVVKIFVTLFFIAWCTLFFGAFLGKPILGLIAFDRIYSDGERVGQIVKISYKGTFWKTWEVTMGVTQSGSYVDSWDFSVDEQDPNKDELVRKLQNAYDNGYKVKIHYLQRMGTLPWRGKTDYFAKDVNYFGQPNFKTPSSTPLPTKR